MKNILLYNKIGTNFYKIRMKKQIIILPLLGFPSKTGLRCNCETRLSIMLGTLAANDCLLLSSTL